MIKTLLKYVAAGLMIGAFYALIYGCHIYEIIKKIYFDMFGIPYRSGRGKFHPYYVRLNK